MKAVILAAGSSSRFKPLSDNKHKGLTEVLGRPIIEHTVEELERLGLEDIIIIEGSEEKISKSLDVKADFVVQEEPKGMGHAIEQASELLDEDFIVLNPYHGNSPDLLEDVLSEHDEGSLFVGRKTENPEDYGVFHLKDGKASGITEKPSPENIPSNLRVVGMYILSPEFFDHHEKVDTWEYSFEDALDLMMGEESRPIKVINEPTASIKYPWDLFEFVEDMMEERGQDISDDAEIAESATVEGDVIIEEGSKIFENAVIRGPVYLGKNTVIGNNTVVRNHSSIEEGATVGANSELRNTVMQPKSSLHSGFLGDSIIGKNTQIGAETVTANRKFREEGERPDISVELIAKQQEKEVGDRVGVFVGEDVDIGVNVSIMPGVQIGSNAKIGPGTVVSENVENGETVYVDQELVRKKSEEK